MLGSKIQFQKINTVQGSQISTATLIDILKLEHNLSSFMTSLSREFIVHTSIGEAGYVDVSHMDSLSEVRILMTEIWDDDMFPNPNLKKLFYFVVNGICIHPHEEERMRAFEILDQGVKVEVVGRFRVLTYTN